MIPKTKSLFLVILLSSLQAEIYPVDIRPKDTNGTFQSIKILDQKEIIIKEISGMPFSEISDLAYDKKRQILHMVGDKGYLYSFKAKLSTKIEYLSPLNAYHITKEKGKKFNKKVDSEGLAFDKKGRLLISFERKPKIGSFSTNAQRIKQHRLPSKLSNRKHYRGSNKMLESVAYHPKHGILTASELPLKRSKLKHQSIYALGGKRWGFLAEPEKKSSVTAIEVMDDGNILILERSYNGIKDPRVITLKKLSLAKHTKGLYQSQVLAKMSSDQGWKVDNFEGLARISANRYLMISDDNGNFFQRTLLIYFEVIE
ncbi:MAG: esterase-like activity of phytase family protein [Sulfurovum sp.]|nr:esterase-like activity of phytase family protein [Sulfurovum sp.]